MSVEAAVPVGHAGIGRGDGETLPWSGWDPGCPLLHMVTGGSLRFVLLSDTWQHLRSHKSLSQRDSCAE